MRIACVLANDFVDSEFKDPQAVLRGPGHGDNRARTQPGQASRAARQEVAVRWPRAGIR
jgi:hypothetical protein